MKSIDKERALEILELIEKFTTSEVSAITIHSPNPDFGGHDHAISYSWVDFNPTVPSQPPPARLAFHPGTAVSLPLQEATEEMFYGDSIYECLLELARSSRNPDIANL